MAENKLQCAGGWKYKAGGVCYSIERRHLALLHLQRVLSPLRHRQQCSVPRLKRTMMIQKSWHHEGSIQRDGTLTSSTLIGCLGGHSLRAACDVTAAVVVFRNLDSALAESSPTQLPSIDLTTGSRLRAKSLTQRASMNIQEEVREMRATWYCSPAPQGVAQPRKARCLLYG